MRRSKGLWTAMGLGVFFLLGAYEKLAAGTVSAVSLAASGTASDTAGGASATWSGSGPSVSADGRYVAFVSQAANLVPGQVEANGDQNLPANSDVFLYDRVTGTVTLVSRSISSPTTTGNGYSEQPAISADGNYVVFRSLATDLVPLQADFGHTLDIFLFDRAAGTTTLITHAAGASSTVANQGGGDRPRISADGSTVLFSSSSTDLIGGITDNNGGSDVFLYDRLTGTTALVSQASGSPGVTANGPSSAAALSADGAYAVFLSGANNLVAGATDTNSLSDAFLFDRAAGTVTLVSHASSSLTTAGNAGAGSNAAMSSDGAYVAFTSNATNLVAGQVDSNSAADLFLWTRSSGAIALVSRASTSAVTAGNGAASGPAISGDGAFVAFRSLGTNHVASQSDSNGGTDCFLWNRATATTALVSRTGASAVTAAGCQEETLGISANGSHVVFVSLATNVVTGQSDANGGADVFVYARVGGTNALASRIAASATTAGNGTAGTPVISADAAYVAFTGNAANHLAAFLDTNGTSDVFLLARAAGTLSTASRRDSARPSATPGGSSFLDRFTATSASADGRYVAFTSDAANLVPGQVDANGKNDVFLRDRVAGTTVLVSRARNTTATAANNTSNSPVISADGRYVAFVTAATNLILGSDSNAGNDVYLFDRVTGTQKLVSRSATSATAAANNASGGGISISADGAFVAFSSYATNLIAGGTDGNGAEDVFLYDRTAGTNSFVSRSAAAATTAGNFGSSSPSISADGRYIAFLSRSTNLVAGQVDAVNDWDVFVFDRVAGTHVLASHQPGLPLHAANGFSVDATISADGSFVAFSSNSANLAAGQADLANTKDLFLFERATGTVTLITHSPFSPVITATLPPSTIPTAPAISADGAWIVFGSPSTNLVAGQVDTNGEIDAFLFERATGTVTLLSHSTAGPTQTGSKGCSALVISRDGSTVAFASAATDLVAGQTDSLGTVDLFLFDRESGTLTLASHTPASGTATGNAGSSPAMLSESGRAAFFSGSASNLVAGDWNGGQDVFVHIPEADLEVSKTDDTATVSPGDPLTYTITVENLGPDPATGVTVTDTFPAFFENVTWTCAASPGSSCAAAGTGDIADTVRLAPGGTLTYTAAGNVTLDAAVTLTNTAEVTLPTDLVDPDPSNNSATDVDDVEP